MPRSLLLGALLALLLATPARAACPGADPCPYTTSAAVGQRSGGVLRFPQAVAIGPDGSVYVADQYSHAIQVFAPDGTFQREIGSTGKGPGGLSSVGAVAVGADNSVYVADGADRIDRFAQDGTLLDSWGSSGSAPGEFRFGAGGGNDSGAGGGIAVANGAVYVADTRNDRIQRFALDGSHPVVIVPRGRLSRPQGIVAAGSRLIVADDDHHRLAVFDTGGRFIRTIGSGPGPQPNQLRNPYDVAVDPSGRLYVADNSNHRVVRYGPASSYVYRARWGSFGSAAGQLQYPRGIAADAQGNSYVADPGNNRIDVFDLGGAPLRTIGSSARVPGQFIAPVGAGADASGLRAVADSVVGRVQLLNQDGSVAAVFGAPAPGPTLLPDPVAVSFDGAGLVYVLDQQRSRILVFDRAGNIIRTIGSRGTSAGQLLSPSALTIVGDTIYVADTGNGRVARFGLGGDYRGSVGSLGAIRGVAVAFDGSRIYAADASTNRIYVLDPNGNDVMQIGGGGSKPGKLRSPAAIALDAAGTLWVADRGNNRVDAFNSDGRYVTSFGERGTAPGQFLEPMGLIVDCTGLITVADSDNNRVQSFAGAAAAGTCSPLPPVQNPPSPVLPTQPKPVPPELTVSPAGTKGIFASRTLRLRVRCDVPCKVTIAGRLADRKTRKKGTTPSVPVRFKTRSLPAGKLTVVDATVSAADIRKLRKAMHGRSGMVANLRVTASADDSAPTVVTRRYLVAG